VIVPTTSPLGEGKVVLVLPPLLPLLFGGGLFGRPSPGSALPQPAARNKAHDIIKPVLIFMIDYFVW
jgi:hypothetical protein